MAFLELRRHAPRDPDEDHLSPDGERMAEEIGRDLPGGYAAVYTSSARRAAETAAWFLRGLGQRLPVEHGSIDGLGSPVEDRWRAAASAASSSRIDDIERVDGDLVEQESARLAGVVRELLAAVPNDGRALAVGHTPLIEAAVYGATGAVIDPLDECDGVLVEERDGNIRVVEEYRRR